MREKFGRLHAMLFQEMPLNEFKDYDEYWEKRGFHAPSLRRANVMAPYIPQGSSVLEIACGDGTIMKYLAENRHCSVYGIDISDKAISYVRGIGFQAEKIDICASEFATFLRAHHFDYILLPEIIEHIQDAEDVVRAIHDASPHSRVIVTIPNVGFLLYRLRLLFGRFPLTSINLHIKEHIRFWTVKDFRFWSQSIGYHIERTIGYNGIAIPGIKLYRHYPALFAHQVLYELVSTYPTHS